MYYVLRNIAIYCHMYQLTMAYVQLQSIMSITADVVITNNRPVRDQSAVFIVEWGLRCPTSSHVPLARLVSHR